MKDKIYPVKIKYL